MSDYIAGKAWKQEKHRRILAAAFRLFTEKGIESVTMPEIAEGSGVSRATLFRYFPSKTELVIATATWKWEEYITWHNSNLSPPYETEQLTAAENLKFFLDSFLELYRNHSDILRFNYNFNSFLRFQAGTPEQKRPYTQMVAALGTQFHEIYERGMRDGTLKTDLSEQAMFSSSFHIMLAAVTRYAVGLVVVYENGGAPENELVMLEELLLERFTKRSPATLPEKP